MYHQEIISKKVNIIRIQMNYVHTSMFFKTASLSCNLNHKDDKYFICKLNTEHTLKKMAIPTRFNAFMTALLMPSHSTLIRY